MNQNRKFLGSFWRIINQKDFLQPTKTMNLKYDQPQTDNSKPLIPKMVAINNFGST